MEPRKQKVPRWVQVISSTERVACRAAELINPPYELGFAQKYLNDEQGPMVLGLEAEGHEFAIWQLSGLSRWTMHRTFKICVVRLSHG